MAGDPADVMRAAQEAAAEVVRNGMPSDLTAIILVIPVYRRALADPASGWREEVMAACRQAIDRSMAQAPIDNVVRIRRPT